MLHGLYFKTNLKYQKETLAKAANFQLNIVNESSETIMRQYKKNATKKLIVRGYEAQLCLVKQTECILSG